MLTYKFVLAALTAFSALPAIGLAADTPAAPCQAAQLTAIRTEFPQSSQSRGEHGDVVVNVTIGKDGRAIHTQVTQSSGYPALDKSATDSIAKHWRFDVSRCAPAELPTDSVVTVQFQRAPQYTVSGTINTRRSTSAATSEQTSSRCDSTPHASGDQIVACVASAPIATGKPQQTLANRSEANTQK
jgi:TonB family protein